MTNQQKYLIGDIYAKNVQKRKMKMDWRIWNERQRKKEKLKKKVRKYRTNSYGNVMFSYKSRRKK